MSANGEVRLIQTWLPRVAALVMLLVISPISPAAIFKVGSAGDYASIQAGVDAALGTPGTNDVRVQAGTYSEHVFVTQSAGTLTLSGGWNSAFTVRDDDPLATLLNATASGRGLTLNLSGTASLTVRSLTIVGGLSNQSGGGAWVALQNTAFLRLATLRFVFDSVQAHASNFGFGGALYVSATEQGAAIIEDSDFLSNSATNSAGSVSGSGIYVSVDSSSNVLVQRCIFDGNSATPSSGFVANGVGVYGDVRDIAQLSVVDSRFLANRIVGDGGAQGAFFDIACSGACQVALARDVFDGNRGALGQFQLVVSNFGSANNQAIVRVDNSVIARGEASGASLSSTTARITAVNLTVADHPGTGLQLDGNWGLTNSIVRSNFSDVVSGTFGISTNNIIGTTDPLFASAANGNYRITAASPARNAGTATPTGGLSLFDLLGETRNNEAAPDIGAYEFGDRIFRGRFERLQ
jgi:hypothetical protein